MKCRHNLQSLVLQSPRRGTLPSTATMIRSLFTCYLFLLYVAHHVCEDAFVVAPYSLPQFQQVLSECRLQCPSTSPSTVSNGNFAGVTIADYFYATDDTMVLAMDKSTGNRCELRHNPEWSAVDTDRVPQTYQATMRLEPNNVEAVTIMQIHSKNFLDYPKGPPVMLLWAAEWNGKTDHLWVKIRTSLEPKVVQSFDLGARPNGFFDLEVTVRDRELKIFINGALKVAYNWDYMVLPQNNFKTGVYLHGSLPGPQAIEFTDLYMGEALPTSSPTTSPIQEDLPRIAHLVLVDTEDNVDLVHVDLHADGVVVLDRHVLPPFSIRAKVVDSDNDATKVRSVWFEWDDQGVVKKENFAPFCISGDKQGDYRTWNLGMNSPGEHIVRAIPFSEKSGNGIQGTTVSISIVIV